MADEQPAQSESGQTPQQQNEQQTQQGQQAPESGSSDQQGDYKGAGSKDALKADLVDERSKRQELERTVNALRDGFAKAFGLDAKETSPEELAKKLTSAQAETVLARTELAVFRAVPAGVDAQALLDSRAFTATLDGVNPTDTAAVAAAIDTFVANNPRFRTTHPGAGARDAGAGSNPPPAAKSMDDWIRGK